MPSNVCPRSFTSCVLAPLATIDNGTPRASTSRLRLRPFFPPVGRIRPHALKPERRLAHRAVDRLPLPGNALHAVVFGQPGLPYPQKETSLVPALKVFVHRARRTEFARQSLPLATGAQDVNDGGKDQPRILRLTACARFAPILLALRPLTVWNQGSNLLPKSFGYGPRLDGSHRSAIVAQAKSTSPKIRTRGIILANYLRIGS